MGLTINSNFSTVSYGASASMKTFHGAMSRSLKKISTGKAYAGGGTPGTADMITNSIKYRKAAGVYEACYYATQASAASQAMIVADLESALEAAMAIEASIVSSVSYTADGTALGSSTAASSASAIGASLASAYETLNGYDYTATYYQNLAGAAEAAYSSVTDTDIAMEMSKYVKANVNAQAAQAMVAQANQSMASILNLLQ